MKYFLLLTSFYFCFQGNSQETKKVLFIGNSYTYVNDLPNMIKQIALSLGDNILHDSSTPGGYTFQAHSIYGPTLSKINAQDWDYVILQAQSQEPAFDPAQVAVDTYPYADSLVQDILANDSCSRIMFYMTWGRKNGDAANCPFYPVICTYEGMQYRLRQSYLEMAQNNNAEVSPVGVTWRTIRQTDTTIELYQPDQSHPSLAGTYVAACTFYCSIFHKPLTGAYIPTGLDSLDAIFIQQTAQSTVFDSLATWLIDTTNTTCFFSGINDVNKNNKVTIYPNPFNSHINFSEAITGKISISDLTGRVIYNSMLINCKSLELTNLFPGIYFLSMEINNVVSTYEIIHR